MAFTGESYGVTHEESLYVTKSLQIFRCDLCNMISVDNVILTSLFRGFYTIGVKKLGSTRVKMSRSREHGRKKRKEFREQG